MLLIMSSVPATACSIEVIILHFNGFILVTFLRYEHFDRKHLIVIGHVCVCVSVGTELLIKSALFQ